MAGQGATIRVPKEANKVETRRFLNTFVLAALEVRKELVDAFGIDINNVRTEIESTKFPNY